MLGILVLEQRFLLCKSETDLNQNGGVGLAFDDIPDVLIFKFVFFFHSDNNVGLFYVKLNSSNIYIFIKLIKRIISVLLYRQPISLLGVLYYRKCKPCRGTH